MKFNKQIATICARHVCSIHGTKDCSKLRPCEDCMKMTSVFMSIVKTYSSLSGKKKQDGTLKDKVLSLITKANGLDIDEIANKLSITTYEVCIITKQLEDEGLIVKDKWLGSDV